MRSVHGRIFQSTLPREERRLQTTMQSYQRNFNPRSHERSDIWTESMRLGKMIFQSTLPREERLTFMIERERQARFQSTLPREERLSISTPKETVTKFQSTLPREERPISALTISQTGNFNPRSHERSDKRMAEKEVV